MTKEEETILHTFETRVRQLILQYKAAERKNDELNKIIAEKNATIQTLESEKERFRSEYENLKIAKMIEISDNDMKNARSRLSKLVRDVDKCIALLNV